MIMYRKGGRSTKRRMLDILPSKCRFAVTSPTARFAGLPPYHQYFLKKETEK